MIMKTTGLFLLLWTFFVQTVNAQKTTESFTIEGEVASPVQITEAQLKSYPHVTRDSVRIFSHDMHPKSLLKNVSGVLLRDVLSAVRFNNENPKVLSEYFIECIASDGYKVVFSWNEIFNSDTGSQAMVITEKNGAGFAELDDRIAIVSPFDKATGRRYVKWLKEILIQRVK